MTRIAVGGFLHETNIFAPTRATPDDFVHGGGWPSMATADDGPKVMRRIIRVKPNGPAFVPPHKSRSPFSANG